MKKSMHLISNAHIDPVWQWDIEEGVSATIATFRSAAMLLEKNEDMIFNHNEAILYMWTEMYEPELFERIKALVKAGRWHIMGGFMVQPDCIMPCGESMTRQALYGKKYFKEKFGVEPSVAINVDSFGHSRGLVQILAKSGYTGYMHMRPDNEYRYPKDYLWKGFDGSAIYGHCFRSGYGTSLGKVKEQMLRDMGRRRDNGVMEEVETFPWGVGNHGGGPSQKDINDLNEFKAGDEWPEVKIFHSTPEAYFEEMVQRKKDIPEVSESLYPIFVGCYTSLMEIKQRHRRLENALTAAEKLSAIAEINGCAEYPKADLDDAWKALSLLQFHDILPGTHTYPVMQRMLEHTGHAMENAKRAIDKALFRLSASEPAAQEGALPIVAVNPHPYTVKRIIECEYMLPDQNWEFGEVTGSVVMQDGKECTSQLIKEDSNINLDWRKRIAFEAELKPLSVTRFDMFLKYKTIPPKKVEREEFDNGELYVRISRKTGLIEEIRVNGVPVGGAGIGQISAYRDTADPWFMTGVKVGEFDHVLEKLDEGLSITEEGDLFTQVEAKFGSEGVKAFVRYRIPKSGRKISIDLTLQNQMPDRLYRMSFPVAVDNAHLMGETMFGLDEAFTDGKENASQRFDILEWEGASLGIVNDSLYGGKYENGVLQKTLLRTPVYCAHPLGERPLLPENRYYYRAGMGEYHYKFVLIPSVGDVRYETALEAQIVNEPPVAVQHFTPGYARKEAFKGIEVKGDVTVSAIKRAEDGDGYVIRVFEPTGNAADFTILWGDAKLESTLSAFEARTYRVKDGAFIHCDFMEKNL